MTNSLRLLLTGDSILQRRLNSRDDAELRPLFDEVRAADVAFTNFEMLANDYRGDPALDRQRCLLAGLSPVLSL